MSAPVKKTVVEEGTEFKGTLGASGPIVVMGRLDGQVTGPSLEVSEAGAVAGTVKVGELRSHGEVAGTIEAGHVALAGRVRDGTAIKAETLEVAEAAPGAAPSALFTDCTLEIGEAPSKAEAVRAALAPPPVEHITGDTAENAVA
jgi:cytoskeletal protein CcmA (bactofilin family)